MILRTTATVEYAMPVREWVLAVIGIFMTLALFVACTCTCCSWRRNFKCCKPNKFPKIGSTLAKDPLESFGINCDSKSAVGVLA